MARSRKNPHYVGMATTGKTRRFLKRLANKVVRRAAVVADGKAYRRLYETWNIIDAMFYESDRDIDEAVNGWVDHFGNHRTGWMALHHYTSK